MAANQYLPFGTAVGANVYSIATYTTDTTEVRRKGYTAGVADSRHVNTVLRQTSVVAAGLAAFAAMYGTVDLNDDGNPDTVRNGIKSALDALYLSQAETTSSTNMQLAENGFVGLPAPGGTFFLVWGTVNPGDPLNSTPVAHTFIYPKALTTAFTAFVSMAGDMTNARAEVFSFNNTQAVIKIQEWGGHVQTGTLRVLVLGFLAD